MLSSKPGKSFRAARATLLAFAVMVLAAGLHAALQEPLPEGQVLHVLLGKSVIINVQARMTRVLVSNPAVIETLATTPNQVVVEGKAAGSSNLILWDESGRSQLLDVVVEPDVSGLRAAVERAYPGQKVEVETDGSHVILSGIVSEPHMIDELAKMATLYSPGVVNSLTVTPTHERQVMLEVRFVEVDRTKIDQLGINFLSPGALRTPFTVSTQQFGPPFLGGAGGTSGGITGKGSDTLPLSVTDLLNVFLFRPDLNIAVTIKDLEQKAVLQILAEPNLMALNGQKASFLAGGEFPFPIVQGGQNVGAVTIQFRPFGVRLDFTGTIGKDNVIRLHVAPEVSTLDFANAISISGFVVPAISTRRAETEIELKDGQSFGIAGLLDKRAQAQLNKIPGIGDIPILGLLFRSKSVNRSNAELLVMVTPHIVDPIGAAPPVPSGPDAVLPFLESPKFDSTVPGNKNAGPPLASPERR